MKPSDLYARVPERTEYDLYAISEHLSEFDIDDYNLVDSKQNEESKRVEIRIYKFHCSDGERIWQLCGVYFDGKPVAVVQMAGRGGHDHRESFITDRDTHALMLTYIRSLCKQEDTNRYYDPDVDVPNLTSFYDNELDQDWEELEVHEMMQWALGMQNEALAAFLTEVAQLHGVPIENGVTLAPLWYSVEKSAQLGELTLLLDKTCYMVMHGNNALYAKTYPDWESCREAFRTKILKYYKPFKRGD